VLLTGPEGDATPAEVISSNKHKYTVSFIPRIEGTRIDYHKLSYFSSHEVSNDVGTAQYFKLV